MSRVHVSAGDAGFPAGIDEGWVRAVCDAVLARLGRAGSELGVVLGDDAFVRALNAEWRGIDSTTDVLSFPQNEFPDGPNTLRPGPAVLGDVAISVDVAARQAAEQGHGLRSELAVLLVHGICHLLGWDHEDPDDAPAMRAVEARLLADVGEAAPGLIERAGA